MTTYAKKTCWLMICTPNLGQNKSKIWGVFYAFFKTR